MTIILIISIIIFILIHGVSLFPKLRNLLIEKFGLLKYKLVYSFIAGVSFLIMFLIMRLYPGLDNSIMNILIYENIHQILPLTSILIVATYIPKNHIRYYLKHPMLIGISLWSLTHLLINTSLHQDVFFAGMLFFCLFMIVGLVLRKGKTPSKNGLSFKKDLLVIILGMIAHYSLIYLHVYLAGVSLT